MMLPYPKLDTKREAKEYADLIHQVALHALPLEVQPDAGFTIRVRPDEFYVVVLLDADLTKRWATLEKWAEWIDTAILEEQAAGRLPNRLVTVRMIKNQGEER